MDRIQANNESLLINHNVLSKVDGGISNDDMKVPLTYEVDEDLDLIKEERVDVK